MGVSTTWKFVFLIAFSVGFLHHVLAQGRGGPGGGGNQKLKEDVEFLKANLSALWDIVSALQTRAAEERSDESDELALSLGLKKVESWAPFAKNALDSQIRVRPEQDSKYYPAISSTLSLYKRKDYSTWKRLKNTDEVYYWHRGTTLLLHLLKADGSYQQTKLGDPIQDPDASPYVNVGAGTWVAAELEDKFSYCLVSQLKAPGWEASKQELGDATALISRFPQFDGLIHRLSPPRTLPPTDSSNTDSGDDQ